MKPLLYGYLRAADDLPDDEVKHTAIEMRRFAETEGFSYATTFLEYQKGPGAALVELVHELQRAEPRTA